MKLTMLGTGNALAMECYNTCFLLEDNGQLFMVDGGGGNAVLHQIRHAGYEAEELGIHNVWLRGFDARTVAEVFDLPENIIPVMMFAMGYPNEKARPNAWHFKRMPLEDFVTEL